MDSQSAYKSAQYAHHAEKVAAFPALGLVMVLSMRQVVSTDKGAARYAVGQPLTCSAAWNIISCPQSRSSAASIIIKIFGLQSAPEATQGADGAAAQTDLYLIYTLNFDRG